MRVMLPPVLADLIVLKRKMCGRRWWEGRLYLPVEPGNLSVTFLARVRSPSSQNQEWRPLISMLELELLKF